MLIVEMCNKSNFGRSKELQQLVNEEEDQGYDVMNSQSKDTSKTEYH
jgi:hypothetical protein